VGVYHHRAFRRLRQIRTCLYPMLLLAAAGRAQAQEGPRNRVGGAVSANLLVGDASDFLDGALNPALFAERTLDARQRFAFRIDASLGGLADDEDTLTGARGENALLIIVAGPQVEGRIGGMLRPYAGPLAGITTVSWKTVEGAGGANAEETGSSTAFAWGGHAGLGVLLARGAHPLTLRLDGRILDTGTLQFARAPDPATSLPTGVIRENIAVLTLQLGLAIGF